jgi:hypothetical protein
MNIEFTKMFRMRSSVFKAQLTALSCWFINWLAKLCIVIKMTIMMFSVRWLWADNTKFYNLSWRLLFFKLFASFTVAMFILFNIGDFYACLNIIYTQEFAQHFCPCDGPFTSVTKIVLYIFQYRPIHAAFSNQIWSPRLLTSLRLWTLKSLILPLIVCITR